MPPNPILTETIDRLCRSEALTAEETGACLHEVMEGRASEARPAMTSRSTVVASSAVSASLRQSRSIASVRMGLGMRSAVSDA